MRFRMLFGITALACALSAGRASAQSIGIFFDADGATCSRQQPANSLGTMWILAILGGSASAGITGAELQVTGFPSGWVSTTSRSPQALFGLGTPMAGGGALAFSECTTGNGGIVLLYRVDYLATSQVESTYLTVAGASQPGNRLLACPVVTLCDFPTFTKLCVRGGQAILNGPTCTVGTEPATWSRVKNVYQ